MSVFFRPEAWAAPGTRGRIALRCIGLLSLSGLLGLSGCQQAAPVDSAQGSDSVSEKTVITRKDDLPRHTYQLDIPATTLYEPENRAVLESLAAQLKNDIEADLAAYDIQDNNTLQGFYGDLGSVALVEGRWQDYLDLLEQRRALETKEANRLTMGITGEAIAKARLAGSTMPSDFVADYLAMRLAELPYATVQDNIKQAKGRSEILTRALVLGSIESGVEPVLENTGGEMSYDIAARLVGTAFSVDAYLPVKDAVNAALTDYIAANKIDKPDIWAQRDAVLSPDADAEPALIAVWDSGVDLALYDAARLWRNPDEIAGNGIDDDGNGFIDDVHGIGWSLHWNPEPALLYPFEDDAPDAAVMERQVKGLADITAAVDSEEASALRKEIGGLEQAAVKDFIEAISLYSNYSHGTHVAGISMAGNPFARLMTIRMTFGHEMIPQKPDLELTRHEAKGMVAVVDYLKANKVRAVNMSWGGSLAGIEAALEAHNMGDTPEERKALARQHYDIVNDALRAAIEGAPDILFITSAGNSDNDVKFDEFYPSGYEYPNVLTVGAVDQAGQETSFTSLGKVDLYANGFEVDSDVPGGNRMKLSGTSMASPQVLNLAGKLLALDPGLSTAELKALILDGTDVQQLESREIRLMNPRASIALLDSQ